MTEHNLNPSLIFEEREVRLPKLFHRTKAGKIQESETWLTLVNNSGNPQKIKPIDRLKGKIKDGWMSIIYTRFGQQDGKKQTSEVEITSGKNIGRSNETNVLKQGILEMTSEWTKKQERKGYSMNLNEASTRVLIKPMLLHKYGKFKHKINFDNAWIQEKFDGVRCLAHYNPTTKQVDLISRTGTSFLHLQHIRAELLANKEFKKHTEFYLDGELFAPELSFEEIVGIVRQETLTPEAKKMEKYIRLYVFDLIDTKNPDLPFTERIQLAHNLLSSGDHTGIRIVKTKRVKSDNDVIKTHKEFRARGGEGSVIRNGDAKYSIDTRSYNILKLKDSITEEFTIVDFTDGKGKEKGMIIFKLKTPSGKTFNAPPNMPDYKRKEMFKKGETYKGKPATVEFMEYTKAGVPRHPKVLAIRDYE